MIQPLVSLRLPCCEKRVSYISWILPLPILNPDLHNFRIHILKSSVRFLVAVGDPFLFLLLHIAFRLLDSCYDHKETTSPNLSRNRCYGKEQEENKRRNLSNSHKWSLKVQSFTISEIRSHKVCAIERLNLFDRTAWRSCF